MPTDYKQLFLRSLKWDAEESGASLFSTLKTAARAKLTNVSGGKVLVGVSANGKTATYALPQSGIAIDASDLAVLMGELINRYEETVTLLVARGVATPTDAQILTEMLALLQPVREVRNDYSSLRYA